VDDIFIFTSGSISEAGILKNILNLFSKAIGMLINEEKSTLTSFYSQILKKDFFDNFFLLRIRF
jgi:hypothetical protein